MKKIALALSLVSGLSLATSCSKEDTNKISASGELSKSEQGLLALLPASGQVVFGGKYAKFVDYWKNSPLKSLAGDLMKMSGAKNDMSDYMNCWMDQGAKDMKLAGTVNFANGGIDMRMVFGGMSKDVFTKCAGKGGMASKMDEDGKYLELQDMPDGVGGKYDLGYYFVDDTTTYFSLKMSMTGGAPKSATRAEIEADIKGAANSSAANSAELGALAKKADRSKSFWFAGTTKGTEAADKLKGGVGWMDADSNSMSMGFSVQLTDSSKPAEAVKEFGKAKEKVGSLPPGFKGPVEALIKDVHLSADGDTLSGRITLKNEILEKLIPQAKMMMGL